MNKILIVEDNPQITDFLEAGLRANGFMITVASTGKQALQLLEGKEFDLVILDLGLPDQDGLSILRTLRGQGQSLPIMILTARDGVENTVAGLERGADDYIAKPFSFEELLARIRVQLRNVYNSHTPQETSLQFGEITLDLLSRQVRLGNQLIDLSAREFLLIEYFLRHPKQVLTREQILDRVWDYDLDPGTNIVNVYIGLAEKG
jgi:DNA-binding response OmpR family regulator